jgi:MoaA/NifB/PqqE/SkfB family radical SAM enzyme
MLHKISEIDSKLMIKDMYNIVTQEKPIKLPKDVVLYGLHYEINDHTKGDLLYTSIYTTHKCQIDCVYCSKHFDIKEVETGKVIILSKNEIIAFIHEAKKLGLRTLIFQGMGEPTEDPNLREYILEAEKLNITSIVFTNLLNLDDNLAKFFYSHHVSLAPSVDTITESTYNFLTNSNMYNIFLKALNTLKCFFGGENHWIDSTKSRVLLSMVLTGLNISDLKSIRTICNDNGWLLCVKAFGVKGAAKENFPQLAYNSEYYFMLQEIAIAFADKVMITQTSEDKCACGGKKGLLIDIDGSIGACGDTLTRVGANIRTQSLIDCFEAKKKYICKLSDYCCLSKALRGFGDVKVNIK